MSTFSYDVMELYQQMRNCLLFILQVKMFYHDSLKKHIILTSQRLYRIVLRRVLTATL